MRENAVLCNNDVGQEEVEEADRDEVPLEAFCRSGDRMALGLGRLSQRGSSDLVITLTRLDEVR